MKGATKAVIVDITPLKVSIRAPREGGDAEEIVRAEVFVVSIRAPREGGDRPCKAWLERGGVSIRAPREGGDVDFWVHVFASKSFNPRPP